jgi:hypothetical protein
VLKLNNNKQTTMSDALKHECGIAQLDYLNRLNIKEKYGSASRNTKNVSDGKGNNRGQDGAISLVLNWMVQYIVADLIMHSLFKMFLLK